DYGPGTDGLPDPLGNPQAASPLAEGRPSKSLEGRIIWCDQAVFRNQTVTRRNYPKLDSAVAVCAANLYDAAHKSQVLSADVQRCCGTLQRPSLRSRSCSRFAFWKSSRTSSS